MILMTIQIPDELARDLARIAALESKSLEQLALERLESLLETASSPQAILRTIRALRHPSPQAVDDLDAAIAAARLPVEERGAFDRKPPAR
jgi:hypothetical protein